MIIAVVVVICSLTVSYSHSLDLFSSVGYHDIFAHLAVIATESVFLGGAVNLIVARLKGRKAGWPPRVAGLFGCILVLWANIRSGLAYGWEGIALGASIPVALVVAESLFGWAVISTSQSSSTTGRSDARQPVSQQPMADHPIGLPVNQTAGRDLPSNQLADQPQKQVTESTIQPADQANGQSIRPASPASHSATTNQDRPASDVADQPTGQSASLSATKVADQPEESINQVAENNQPKRVFGRSAKVVEMSSRKSANHLAKTGSNQPVDEQLAEAVRVAEKYLLEHGRLPSQRKLADLAGCSRYKASQALEQMKAGKKAQVR